MSGTQRCGHPMSDHWWDGEHEACLACVAIDRDVHDILRARAIDGERENDTLRRLLGLERWERPPRNGVDRI